MNAVVLASLAADLRSARKQPPLGCLALQAALAAAGLSAEVRDLQRGPLPRDAAGLADWLDSDAPVLGVSTMADRLPLALLALAEVRRRRPAQLLVLGGPGPTEVAEDLVRRFSWLDAVVCGEGEETFVDLLRVRPTRDASLRRPVAGAIVRSGSTVLVGAARPRLATWPALALGPTAGFPWHAYDDLAVLTARGCPHVCTFCSAGALWGHRVVERPLDAVIAEIARLSERNPGAFVHVEDDTFTLRRERVLAFCDGLESAGLRVTWGCTARVGRLDAALLERMAAAGCRSLFFGVEAGSDAVLHAVRKGFSAREARDAVLLAARYCDVTAHAVWGFPFEDLGAFYDTYLLMADLAMRGVHARLSHLVPFVGAPLARAGGYTRRALERFPFPRLVTVEPGSAEARLVAAHPDVFLPFFALETPDWRAKWAFASRYHAFLEPQAAAAGPSSSGSPALSPTDGAASGGIGPAGGRSGAG